MSLAPEIASALREAAALQLPAYWDVPVQESRALKAPPSCVPEPIGHSVTDRYIPGPSSDLHVRIFRPSAAATLPALVFYHGGGFVFNNIDMYTAALHRLCNKSGTTIVAVNYQKAPEHPFPAAFDDCYATLRWVVANATSLGVDVHNIGVGGDSAGGNLASAVALKARDEGPSIVPPLRYQLLIYPCNDRDLTTASYTEFAEGFGLSKRSMEWFWEMYLGPVGGEHDDNPYACPMRAPNFAQLPPAIIVVAECDPLRSDSEKYAGLLREAGVPVEYKQYDGMNHGFIGNLDLTPSSPAALDYMATRIAAAVVDRGCVASGSSLAVPSTL